MNGHYAPNTKTLNEVWGLATFHQNENQYATCADDATLRIWSRKDKKQLHAISLNIDEKG